MQNWLTKQVNLNPKRIALTFGKQQWTFEQMQTAVIAIAEKITTLVGSENSRIAIVAKNTPASYLTILATQQLGLEPVLLNYRLAKAELSQQIKNADVDMMLVDDELTNKLTEWQALPVKIILFKDLAAINGLPAKVVAEFNPNQVASIMYTSGTTGVPHGVMQTFDNHFNSAISSALNLGLQPNDRWLCAVPLFHISGLSIMMRSLVYGMAVDLVSHFDERLINQRLLIEPITMMSVVPTMLTRLLAQVPKTGYNAKFRGFLLGGGPIDVPTLEQCQQLKIPVIQSYGMTETASQIVTLNYKNAAKKIGSVGKPLFSVEIRLANVIKGIGEIEVKTPNLAKGYLNQAADFTRKLTADGWYKTGDLGAFDEDGFLFIKGRQDDMFISGGENVFPDEIEQVYTNVPEIKQIAVVGKKDSIWGMVPVAFVNSDVTLNNETLRAIGRKALAHYKVPVEFIQLGEFPTTVSGKVQRHRLRRLLENN